MYVNLLKFKDHNKEGFETREKNDIGNMKFEQQMWQEDIVEGNVLPTRVINTIHVIGYEIHTVDHRPRIVINSYNK